MINPKKISTFRFIESSQANGQTQNTETNKETDKPVYRELKSRLQDRAEGRPWNRPDEIYPSWSLSKAGQQAIEMGIV